MAFWGGKRLAERLPSLVTDYDDSRVDCAAYTLRMGRQFYLSAADEKYGENKLEQLAEGGSLTIPPGQFAVLLSEETVTVPTEVIAFISMKTGLKGRGLVNVSGFHVDPGYSAPLRFSVFNAGPSPICIRQGDDCFLIWYADLIDSDEKYAKTEAQNRIYRKGILGSDISSLSGPVRTVDVLAKKIDSIDKNQQILNVVVGIVATGAVAMSPVLWWLVQLGIEYLAKSSSP